MYGCDPTCKTTVFISFVEQCGILNSTRFIYSVRVCELLILSTLDSFRNSKPLRFDMFSRSFALVIDVSECVCIMYGNLLFVYSFLSRIGCYITVFQNISNLRDVFYKEMSVVRDSI